MEKYFDDLTKNFQTGYSSAVNEIQEMRK